MKVTIESTNKIVTLKPGSLADGVPARIWEGVTENGIKVHCFITRVAADKDADQEEFQKELSEYKPPSPEIEAYPSRLIL